MHKLRWALLALLLIALGTMSAGCTETIVSQPEIGVNTNSNQDVIQTSAVDSSYPGLQRIIASQYLVGYISVVDPKLGRTGQFTKAQVSVQNLTQNRYELEYQYQWEDQSGFAVGSPRPWKRFVLQPMETENISELALQKNTQKAIFTVRLVDDTFIEMNKNIQKTQ